MARRQGSSVDNAPSVARRQGRSVDNATLSGDAEWGQAEIMDIFSSIIKVHFFVGSIIRIYDLLLGK